MEAADGPHVVLVAQNGGADGGGDGADAEARGALCGDDVGGAVHAAGGEGGAVDGRGRRESEREGDAADCGDGPGDLWRS